MTALTATPNPSDYGSVLLNVTGAPGKPVSAYASNFGSTTDGWSATSGTLTRATSRTPVSLDLAGPVGLAKRTITGLTVGAMYRLRVFYATYRSQVRLGVSGIGTGSYLSGGTYVAFNGTPKYVSADYTFRATTSSHDITVEIAQAMGVSGSSNVAFNTVTVEPVGSWLGTTITRTDVNGTNVPVRMPVGTDVASGSTTLNLYDFEAALIGPVTYTVTDGLGGTATAITTLAEYRRNYVTNPAGRTNTTRWAVSAGGGTAAVTQVATGGPDGGSFIRATWSVAQTTGTGNAGLMYDLSGGAATVPVNPGDYLSGRVWVRTSLAQRMTLYIQYLNSSGVSVQSTNSTPIVTTANGWTEIVFNQTIAAPAGAVKAHALLYSITGTGSVAWPVGGTLDATYLLLEKTTSLDVYFDGATPNSGTTQTFWTGTADASASVMTSPLAKPGVWLTLPATSNPADAAGSVTTYAYRNNLVQNPSAEVSTDGWTPSNCTLTRDTTQAWVGSASFKMTSATSGRPIITPAFDTKVTPGTAYTFSAYLKTTATLSQPYFVLLEFYDSAYSYLTGYQSSTFTTTGGAWQRFSATGMAPANAVFAYMYVIAQGTSTVTTDVVYVDGMLMESGTVLLPYFDGSTAASGTKTYQWSGSAGVWSISTETTATTTSTGGKSGTPPRGVAVSSVVDYGETSDSNGSLHKIIGRADPIANPGPLALRSGSLDVWCTDYSSALAVRSLLSSGEIGHWRQPDYPDMDLYFAVQSVGIQPEDTNQPQRWIARVGYDEVLAP